MTGQLPAAAAGEGCPPDHSTTDHPKDADTRFPPPLLLQARLRDGFGRWRDTESTISDQRHLPAVGALVLHVRDVCDRRELERSLHLRSWTDELTGLANLRKLRHAVGELGVAAGRSGALLVIAVEGLAEVRTAHGHEAAAALLVEAAHRVQDGLRDGDLAVRLDGEAFAVLINAPSVPAYAHATRLVTTLSEPYRLPGLTGHLSATIGIAKVLPEQSADDLLRDADLACRRAAQLGRGRVECFNESVEAALIRRATIERTLPGAIERDELDLAFQPVLDLARNRPIGVEALLRWHHPVLGAVPPEEVIAVADSLGVLDRLGRWVVRRACRQLSRWRRDGRRVWMSINASATQLRSDTFAKSVRDALTHHGVLAEDLIVELTECGLDGDDPLVISHLTELRKIGVRTAIDRFGVDQAALDNLRRLPVDFLKIDRTLLAEPTSAVPSAALVLQVVAEMGHRLGVDVIATGLEQPHHVEAAIDAGCRLGQGHLLAAPGHAEHVEAFLEQHRVRLF